MATAAHITSLTFLQVFAASRVVLAHSWPHLAVAVALALPAVLYLAFCAIAGHPLTRAAIASAPLRIAPCFALGRAFHLARRSGVADSRKALAVAAYFIVAVIAGACLRAPAALTVSGFAGLIISWSQVSKSGSQRFSHGSCGYFREIGYTVYMVCIACEALFVNGAVNIGLLSGKQLPPLLSICLLVTLAPVAAVGHHLIAKPARTRMKLWRQSRPIHNFATANAR